MIFEMEKVNFPSIFPSYFPLMLHTSQVHLYLKDIKPAIPKYVEYNIRVYSIGIHIRNKSIMDMDSCKPSVTHMYSRPL